MANIKQLSSILGLSLGLTGCFYQTVSENDIRMSEKVCGGRENLSEIVSKFTGVEHAICRNGETYYIYKKE